MASQSQAQDAAFDQQVTQVFWQQYFLSDEYIPGSDSEHCIVLFSRFFRGTGAALLKKVPRFFLARRNRHRAQISLSQVSWESDDVVLFNYDDLNSKLPRSWEFAECLKCGIGLKHCLHLSQFLHLLADRSLSST